MTKMRADHDFCMKCSVNQTIHKSGICQPCRLKNCTQCKKSFDQWLGHGKHSNLCSACRPRKTRLAKEDQIALA
jgi:hypothetical protein